MSLSALLARMSSGAHAPLLPATICSLATSSTGLPLGLRNLRANPKSAKTTLRRESKKTFSAFISLCMVWLLCRCEIAERT